MFDRVLNTPLYIIVQDHELNLTEKVEAPLEIVKIEQK